MVDFDEVLALGTTPIPGDEVAGVSVRYEPEYEVISAEMSKLEGLEGEEVKWSVVTEHATALLRDKTKDVLIAVYLAAALYEQEGLPGLNCGIKMLHQMCETFWEQAFPEVTRLRARRSALSWFSERMEAQLQAKLEWTGDELKAAQDCFASLEAFRAYVYEPLDNDDGMGGIARNLRERSTQAEGLGAATESDDGAEAAPASDESAVVAQPGATAPQAAVADGKIHTREQAFAKLAEINQFLTKTEPHSPIGPLLSRAIRWSSMEFDDVFNELMQADSDALDRMRAQLGIRTRSYDD